MALRNQHGVKFALISHVLPPSESGQAVALYRLLRGLDPHCYCLMSRENYTPKIGKEDASPRLNASYYHFAPTFGANYLRRLGLSGVGNWLQTIHRARQISRIVRRERFGAIVSCSGDLFDLPAGYLASRWAKVRFYAYLFDDYLHQWIEPLEQCFAKKWEKILIEGATGVIAPNEFLAEAYGHRYGMKPTVIHNPCEEFGNGSRYNETWSIHPREIKIVYTGAIYHAHFDAFRNLLVALREMKQPEIKLHLYTSQSPFDLERQNIQGPVVFFPHLPVSKVAQVQQQADILFLALAFHSPFPEVIKTSAPGKMGEYLASGRPVLVHAPSDSFLSWYFKENGCGLVVERDEPAALGHAIERLLQEGALRETLVRNAIRCAKRDFSSTKAQTDFLRLFQPMMGGEICASSS